MPRAPGEPAAAITRRVRLEPAGIEADFDVAVDEVGCGAVAFANRLDEIRAVIQHAGTVVGGVSGGQGAVGDEPLKERPPLRFGIVMDAMGVGHECESVCDRA